MCDVAATLLTNAQSLAHLHRQGSGSTGQSSLDSSWHFAASTYDGQQMKSDDKHIRTPLAQLQSQQRCGLYEVEHLLLVRSVKR
jgi:hypothetical protein